MGSAKDVKTATDDVRMDTGDASPYALKETGPPTAVDAAAAARADSNANHADTGVQVEEPGYGYGV
jgi:hypothetical protein